MAKPPARGPGKSISGHAPLILASGSAYRAELLSRLYVPFLAVASNVDESRLPDEAPEHLVERLALAKAQALQPRFPDRWILGSDQAATVDGTVLGKPGTRARAQEQLRLVSGRTVQFLTAIALIKDRERLGAVDVTIVRFRVLTDAEIDRYLDAEAVLDCAGSFKCEGLGISLFEEIRSSDPTGLIGLPLIAVRRLLAQIGISVP